MKWRLSFVAPLTLPLVPDHCGLNGLQPELLRVAGYVQSEGELRNKNIL